MATRLSILGGSDWTDGEVLFANDLNDTFNNIINNFSNVFDSSIGDAVVDGCILSEQSTPDQTAQISSGTIMINGLLYNVNANPSISFTNADATNPRYDLVSIDKNGNITVTDGTPAVTPLIPTLPADEVPIAYVYRAAGDNVIDSADITDCRYLLNYNGLKYLGGYSGETNSVTITIPAFTVKKYIVIEADGEITSIYSSTPLEDWASYGTLTVSSHGNSISGLMRFDLEFVDVDKQLMSTGGASVVLKVNNGDGTFDVNQIMKVSGTATSSVNNGSGEYVYFKLKSMRIWGI